MNCDLFWFPNFEFKRVTSRFSTKLHTFNSSNFWIPCQPQIVNQTKLLSRIPLHLSIQFAFSSVRLKVLKSTKLNPLEASISDVNQRREAVIKLRPSETFFHAEKSALCQPEKELKKSVFKSLKINHLQIGFKQLNQYKLSSSQNEFHN